jgi:hypothetical protein
MLFSLALVALVAPSVALAQGEEVRLALHAVGQPGPYFDLTMRPGETRRLDVEISNAGSAPIAARTYASDVYTIVNGGFGDRLRNEPQTGTTSWINYATEVIRLPTGKGVSRSFTVAVPADATAGEYATSVVVENDQPLRADGSVILNQVVRQAVAVVVTIPGHRSPALVIGAATHKVVAGRSVVAVAIDNTGNVRLKPRVAFTLFDAAGAEVSHASVQMDTFYARTDTFVEMPLAALLLPGTYTVRLLLNDADQGAEAHDNAIPFVVAPAATVDAGGAADTTPGAAVNQTVGEGQLSVPIWAVVLVASLLLGLVVLGFGITIVRRRRSRPSER